VFGILETAGEELLRAYRAPMRTLLASMVQPHNGYIEEIKQHLNSQEFYKEV